MIPKIIHYCWFGRNPLPELAQKCIESWKKYLPEYEIKKWNEDNFDVNIVPYTAEAYKAGKFAFVSDYARFWILYNYGGLYFDTDVGVIKPMDEIVENGPFMGCELSPKGNNLYPSVAPGLGLGVNPGLGLIEKMMHYYDGQHFEFVPGGIGQLTIVHIATEVMEKAGLKQEEGIQIVGDVWVYPAEYFCPINLTTGRIHVQPNTRTIHHYAGTWQDKHFSFKEWLKKLLPEKLLLKLLELKSKH